MDWVATTCVPEPLAAAQPQMMEINQQAGHQTSRPSPKVPTPIRKAPTPVTNIMKNAPSTVEYSIPRGPNRKVRMKATPTDFWPPTATTVELLTTVDGWEGVAAGGGVGATLLVHSVPSHQRCPGWEGSAYHLPVVVLTRTQDPETGLESLRRGAQDYLVKSRTDADTLARAIRFAVVRQRLQAVQRRRSAQDRELHDDVIQQLFAIGVAMQATERRSVDQPGIADRIADHLNGLHRVLRQVRSTLIDTETEPQP